MRTKSTFFSLALSLCIVVMMQPGVAKSQVTSGTLTFSVTTTEPSGGYTGAHCLALWIRNSSGTFIKTKVKYADSRQQYLNQWVSNSGTNTVDAVTGSTLNSHGTRTFTWNATNVSGTVVNDDNYAVWLQMADDNTNGPTASVTFTKGTTPMHLTPPNSGNFTNMILDWVPSNIGIETIETTRLFNVSPNPVNSSSTMNYSLVGQTDVTITIYELTGRLVKVLLDKNQDTGNYHMSLYANDDLKPGVYFVTMYTGKSRQTIKILVAK